MMSQQTNVEPNSESEKSNLRLGISVQKEPATALLSHWFDLKVGRKKAPDPKI